MGQPDVRLPPELRHRHGRDDRQGNQGSRSGYRVPPRRPARQRRRRSQRRGARQVGFDHRHDPRVDAQLRSLPGAEALQDCRPAEKVRQDLRRHRQGLRQGDRRSHQGGHRHAPVGSLELPVHRGHVVPGPVQLRLPPHRNVHHSVCDAAGGNLLLRLQHGHRLAQHHREDAHDGDPHQVV